MDETCKVEVPVERRSPTDRRQRRMQAFCWQFFKARRVGERRLDHAGVNHYVDVHGPGLLLVILLILLLCIADAYLTLTLLNHGGEELNPVMKVLIEDDWGWFFYVKYAITACALIFLLMHKNFRVFGGVSGVHILLVVLLAYACLIGYEIKLLTDANLFLLS